MAEIAETVGKDHIAAISFGASVHDLQLKANIEVFTGAFNMTMIVMLNNTIEYDEVRFHERHDSIISAVRSFATKLAQENLLRKM